MRNIHNTIQDEGNREEGYVYLADLIKNYDKSKNHSSLEAPQVASKFGRRSKSNAVNNMHQQTHAADDDKPRILEFMDGHPGMK